MVVEEIKGVDRKSDSDLEVTTRKRHAWSN